MSNEAFTYDPASDRYHAVWDDCLLTGVSVGYDEQRRLVGDMRATLPDGTLLNLKHLRLLEPWSCREFAEECDADPDAQMKVRQYLTQFADWIQQQGPHDLPRSQRTRTKKAPQSPNGQFPDTGSTAPTKAVLDQQALLDLVLSNPDVQPALKRDVETDPMMHDYYDQVLAEAGIKAGWDEDAIRALITEGNTRSARPAPPTAACKLLIQQARLRTKIGNLDEARGQVLAYLSTIWGLRIQTVIRHGVENALWHLELDDSREIHLGTSKDLLSQAQVRFKVFDVTGHAIKRYSAREAHLWDHHVELLALAAITVDTPEMTRRGQAKSLVLGYLETYYCPLDHDTSSEEWATLALSNRPFVRQGMLCLSPKHLWLGHVRIVDPKMPQSELFDLLRLLGGKRITIAIDHPKKTSRSVWRIDPQQLNDTAPAEAPLTSLTDL